MASTLVPARGKKQAKSLQAKSLQEKAVFIVRQPLQLTQQVDRLSASLGVSRNGLVNMALSELLRQHGKQANG